MTRFKKCENQGCDRTVTGNKTIRYVISDAKLGQYRKPIKIKVCNRCFLDYGVAEETMIDYDSPADIVNIPYLFSDVGVNVKVIPSSVVI